MMYIRILYTTFNNGFMHVCRHVFKCSTALSLIDEDFVLVGSLPEYK